MDVRVENGGSGKRVNSGAARFENGRKGAIG